jgi:AcrR family transcriptional regulator
LNDVQELWSKKFTMTDPPTKSRRAKLSETLIAAAERLIETQGLAGVKARVLAQAAGCALGAIYTAFPDLDALILAVSARTLAKLDAHLAPALGQAGGSSQALTPEGARGKLEALALAYLDFAAAHPASWRALFEHRLPEGRAVPEWLITDQSRLFGKVETLLGPLVPRMDSSERALLARTLFSAVHGVVLLGLEEKLAPMPLDLLRRQLSAIVGAMAVGLRATNQ